ncbi:MAG: serine hydrolase [Bacteroidota bacterium]
MKYPFLSLVILSALLIACSTKNEKQQPLDKLESRQLDSLMIYSHEHGMFNGSVAVVRNDSVLFQESYGLTGQASAQEIDAETIFYIASIAKQFTAMGIMILQERGLLQVDDALGTYLPQLTSIDDQATIRHLLQHTAGISDRTYYQLENPDNQAVLEQLRTLDASGFGAANQRFSYSNTGYVLLALIIEKVSGRSIQAFLQEEIFTPLGMNRTTTSKEEVAKDKNRADGYSVLGKPSSYQSSVIGPAGIYSTINDLLSWNAAINQGKLISAQTLKQIFANGQTENGPISFQLGDDEYGYGFGWMPFQKGKDELVRHDGSTEGFRSLIRKNLSQNVDILMLTNHGGALAMDEITDGIDEILNSQRFHTPNIPLPNRVINQLNQGGIDSVVSMLHATIDPANKPDERVLGRLGYTLQNNGRLEEAIQLYRVNLGLYPESSNALYVLGEAYLSTEKYSQAREIYQQFLTIKPESEYAREKLALINAKPGENP